MSGPHRCRSKKHMGVNLVLHLLGPPPPRLNIPVAVLMDLDAEQSSLAPPAW